MARRKKHNEHLYELDFLEDNQSICLLCGEISNYRQFVTHRNKEVNSHISMHKNCLNEINPEDKESIISALRLLNIPYIEKDMEKCIQEDEEIYFTSYLQIMALKSSAIPSFVSGEVREIIDIYEFDGDDLVNLEKKWGKQSEYDYGVLENTYNSYVQIREPLNLLEEERYIQASKTKLKLDQLFDDPESRATDVKNLADTYNKMLADLELNSTNEEDYQDLGVRIEQWERTKPIPDVMEELEDFDGLDEKIRKNFLIHVKKMFGKATEEEIQEMYESE